MKKNLVILFLCLPFILGGATVNPTTSKLDFCTTIEEEDGSPSNASCLTLKVSNTKLTDNGDGTFSLDIPSGGSSEWTDAGGLLHPNENADTITVGSTVAGGKIFADGDTAGEITLQAQAVLDQTADILVVENSTGKDVLTASLGGVKIQGDFVVSGSRIRFDDFDCSTETNGGVLTTDPSGTVICAADDGGGTNVALDLSDNGSNDSDAINEIATTNDTNSIFTEPSADKLLIDAGQNWPTADTANAGDNATSFFSAGTIEHERGGLESDVSAFSGLVAISGGTTSEVNSKSELESEIADVADFAEADGDTYTGTHDFSAATIQGGISQLGNADEIQLLIRANDVQTTDILVVRNPSSQDIITASSFGGVKISNNLVVTGTSIRFEGFACSANSNGGVLTTDAAGTVKCDDDDSGGTDIVLNLGNDGSDESTALNEIATTGDTNSIFTEPSADKLLIDASQNWPTADTANAGDSATSFFSSGTIEHERGGLESDVSAFTGVLAISAGGVLEVDTKSELESQMDDVSDFAEADGDTYTGTHDFSAATIQGGIFQLGNADENQLRLRANSTQETDLWVFEESDGTDIMTGAVGGVKITPDLTVTGTITADGLTLGANENITLGGQTLDHDGTDFLFNDTVHVEVGDNAFIAHNTTDAASNQVIHFVGNTRATAVDDDEGFIIMELTDSASNEQEFARITWVALDVTDTSEDGSFLFGVQHDGTLEDVLILHGVESAQDVTIFNQSGNDLDHRFEGLNDPDLLFMDASVDTITIGSQTSLAKFGIDGDDSSQAQLVVQGAANQDGSIFIMEESDGTDVMTGATGGVKITPNLTVAGKVIVGSGDSSIQFDGAITADPCSTGTGALDTGAFYYSAGGFPCYCDSSGVSADLKFSDDGACTY